jgi:hypothetical protein
MWLGLTADDSTWNEQWYVLTLSDSKPRKHDDKRLITSVFDYHEFFCKEKFEKITGVKLKKGQIKEVKQIRFVWKEKK